MDDPISGAFRVLAEDLNAQVTLNGVRRYQEGIALAGRFRVQCPLTGDTVAASRNYVAALRGAVYVFDGAQPFALVASRLHKGHPLTCAVTRSRLHPLAEAVDRDEGLEEIARSALAESRGGTRTLDAAQPVQLVVGNPNFAHYMWNEFPWVCDFQALGARFEMSVLHDPLAISARLAEGRVHFAARRDAFNGWQTRLSLLAGATHCGADAKERLLKLLGLDPPAATPHEPRVYLSFRSKGRALRDQSAFLGKLIVGITRRIEGARFLIDGFSLPADFHRPIYDPIRASFAARVDAERRGIAACLADLPADLRRRVSDITGHDLRSALPEIGRCFYYVTHGGTQQHKIAWFFRRPGFVHGNRASLTPGAIRWLAAQVADSEPPGHPDPADIEDLDVDADSMPASNERNRDYRIRDVSRIIDAIASDAVQKSRMAQARSHYPDHSRDLLCRSIS